MDVFISYSSKDQAWVRGELLQRLERAGLKAFIDFRDFTRGAPSIKEMARGVEACPKTVVVLTPDYVASEWCDLELVMGRALSPANRDLRIIPLLRAPCEKPLYVSTLTHIDFTEHADQDLAWRQLLTALGKPPAPNAAKEPQRDRWFLAHPYPMPPNFTGRDAEREMLGRWLEDDVTHPLLSLRALGGFGKSALVWHWLTHDVQPASWPRVVWWSFYEGDASFDRFLAKALDYLIRGKVDATRISLKDAVRTLWEGLHEPGTLLILDGFERVLRAFGGLDAAYRGDEAGHGASDRDCISLLAEDFLRGVGSLQHLKSKVLVTTRLCPRVLEAKGGGLLVGCREEPLEQMEPADAVAFFRAQGIRGTHTEIQTACEPYGYHPLSLRLLAGLIVGDFQQPGDVAVTKRLDVSGDLVQRQHHVLEVAYDSLSPLARALLGRIACFRGSVTYETLIAVAQLTGEGNGINKRAGQKNPHSALALSPPLPFSEASLDADLRELVARGLLHHDTRRRQFDLHPIVRRYAYDRLTATDRAAAHTRLRDYFGAVSEADNVTCLEDLDPLIELYHHTVRVERFEDAHRLFRDRLTNRLYYQFGANQLIIDLLRALFPDGEGRQPRLRDESDQAWTLNELAASYGLIGQPRHALQLYEASASIDDKLGREVDVAVSLFNLAHEAQRPIGALRAAETNLTRSIALSQLAGNKQHEAGARQRLGLLLSYRGAWHLSRVELEASGVCWSSSYTTAPRGGTRLDGAYLALLKLLQLRSGPDSATRTSPSVIELASRALELAEDTARKHYPVERDYVRAYWLLGAAHRVCGQPNEAEYHLHEALERCRRFNMVDQEGDILIDLARLCAARGAAEAARRLAEEALVIAERSEYVLQGSDAHLELARLALARGDKKTAMEHAKEALGLATCDGPPDYTYKVAYDEAAFLLAE